MKKALIARVGSGLIGLSLLATALPALADTSTTTATTTPGTYNVACVQTAITVREDANASALATYNASVASALSIRKTELVAAWAQTGFTARFEALKAAMVKYHTAIKTAGVTYKNSRTTTQTTFQSSMKACGVTQADVTGTTTAKTHMKKEKHEDNRDGDKDAKGHGKMGFGLDFDGNFGLHFGKDK